MNVLGSGRIFKPVLRQFQVADDLRPQQADHIRELAELVPREDLLGHRRAADDVPPFQHHDLLAGPRQIRRGHQPVVPAADDDRVVVIYAHALFIPGLTDQKGNELIEAYPAKYMPTFRIHRPFRNCKFLTIVP